MEKTEKQRSDKEPILKPDALIERIAPDASEIPDVRVIAGFLGKSTRRRHWRLYLTPTLNEYVEFAEDDVVHSHSLETDENRLGGTVVWVRREANLVHTRAVSREAQADFLQGNVLAALLKRCRPNLSALNPRQPYQLALLKSAMTCGWWGLEFDCAVMAAHSHQYCDPLETSLAECS